ncbi:MAG: multidrug effflux MFS transporter [Pigmentiphaga sp.]
MGKATEVRGIPGWLVLMGLLTMSVPLGIDMYLPAFPDIAASYGTDVSAIERTLPVFLFGMALGQLVFGPFSDRYGRRLPLYLGVILFIIGSLGSGLADNLNQLMFWRGVQALGCSACMVVPRAVIRDHYQTQAAARAMSLLVLITGAAPLLAPSLGGQVLLFAEWPMVFYLQVLFGIGLLIAMMKVLRESLPREARRATGVLASLRTYGLLLRHRQFMAMSLAGGLAMGGLFAYLTGSPRVFIEVYGLSPQWYGPLFAFNAVVMIIASQINSRLLRHHHPLVLLRRLFLVWPVLGLIILTLAAAGMITFGVLIASLVIFMFGLGIVSPNGTAMALAFQGERLGSASALMGALQFLAGTLGGFAVSAWRAESAVNLVAVMMICMIAACALGWQGLRLSESEAGSAAKR